MKHAIYLATCILISLPSASVAQAGLSPEAQLIFDRVLKDNAEGSLCGDSEALENAVREATKALLSEGVLTGKPRAQAQEAGAHIKASCG